MIDDHITKKPPGWFRIAVWSGLAGAVGLLGILLSLATE